MTDASSSVTAPGGALAGVMDALAWVPRLVALHLCWTALVLLGGVIGGVAPATATMLAVLRGEEAYARIPARFRRELVPANAAAGPFVLLGTFALLDLGLGVAGLLPAWFMPTGLVVAAPLAVLALLALPHALCLHALRPGAPATVIWRGALAGPVLLPIATGSWAITIMAAVIVSLLVRPLGLLMAGGILVTVTSLVLLRTWQSRLDIVRSVAPADDGANR
jgi:uncharacterized membrane protein YesL